MAATETSFGCGNANFGIPNEETGMIVESITHDYSNTKKEIKDRTGNVCGVTFYDEMVKVSINGKMASSSANSNTLAAALTTANDPNSAYLDGTITSTYVEGITIDYSNEDYASIKISATSYPNF